jgi:2-polyprenyl-3-methyl-5-hydroxy-6-metoxy-1,4-benzoquinol methylase
MSAPTSARAKSLDRKSHWEGVYRAKDESQLSWHQDDPRLSLDLVREHCPRGGRVIDVGGGSSILAGGLVAGGFDDVTVLDISDAALQRARQRAGEAGRQVHWVAADVLSTPPLGQFDLWHDRAVFHFLTNADDRRQYVQRVRESVRPGGHVVIATFAPEGPEQCSGLPVRRYGDAALAAEFGREFLLIKSLHEAHVTPWGKAQAFVYVVLQRQREDSAA